MDGPYTPSTPTSHLNGTNGIHGSSPTPPDEAGPSSSFDSGIFRNYLLSLPPVLGAAPEEIEFTFDSDFEEQVARFASEGTGVIYIVKRKDDVEYDMPPTFSYILTTHLSYTPSDNTTLALIKRAPTLDPIARLHGDADCTRAQVVRPVREKVRWAETAAMLAFTGESGCGGTSGKGKGVVHPLDWPMGARSSPRATL